jgi:GT2 family glycosyltransferase
MKDGHQVVEMRIDDIETGRSQPLSQLHGSGVGQASIVVPVRNAMSFLPRTAPTILAAARRSGAEVVYVDNGSTDDSVSYLRAFAPAGLRVLIMPGASIAAVRNLGAKETTGEYIAFLDADCAIDPDYVDRAVQVLARSGAAATGSQVDIPPEPHWIESAWHDLHHVAAERTVAYLNSGNFFTRRDAFQRVGGFREDLATGEDAELGLRYESAGLAIHESPTVKAVHYGNPQSTSQFYRRMLWHGLGMFGTVDLRHIDRPTAMMAMHLVLTCVGVGVLVGADASLQRRLAVVLASQVMIPLLTVLYRKTRVGGGFRGALVGVWLYWLYYWARLHALLLVVAGRTQFYWK